MPDLLPSARFELIRGDVLFQDINCLAACEAIEAVSVGFKNARVTHLGLFVVGGLHGFVLEALYPQVALTPLKSFLDRSLDEESRPRVFVGRVLRKHARLVDPALQFALTKRGLPYDAVFNEGDSAYYCSELVVDAFKHANRGRQFFPEHPMSFGDPKTGTTHPYWEAYFKTMGCAVPEGEIGSNPGTISLSPKLKILHRYGFLTGWEA